MQLIVSILYNFYQSMEPQPLPYIYLLLLIIQRNHLFFFMSHLAMILLHLYLVMIFDYFMGYLNYLLISFLFLASIVYLIMMWDLVLWINWQNYILHVVQLMCSFILAWLIVVDEFIQFWMIVFWAMLVFGKQNLLYNQMSFLIVSYWGIIQFLFWQDPFFFDLFALHFIFGLIVTLDLILKKLSYLVLSFLPLFKFHELDYF